MKTRTLKRPERGLRRALCRLWTPGAIVMSALLLAGVNANGQPTVSTLGGGFTQGNQGTPNGYTDGSTLTVAQFNNPIGLALDATANDLYVADRDNNAIRKLQLSQNQTITFVTNQINKPVGVAVDGARNLYVLNRGSGTNGTVLKFDRFSHLIATNATGLAYANAIALDGATNIYVTMSSNVILKITPGGVATAHVIAGTGTNVVLQGITVMDSGLLAACDAGGNGILIISPISWTATKLTGFNGPGDSFGTPAFAQFNQPYGIAAGCGTNLVVTDNGNHRVKVVDPMGNVCSLYGIISNNWTAHFLGWFDGADCGCEIINADCANSAEAKLPAGVIIAPDGTFYTSEDGYHVIRHVMNPSANGLGITFSFCQPGTLPPPSFFGRPTGVAVNSSSTLLYIADQSSNAVRVLDTVNNQTTTFVDANTSPLINQPVAVAVDSSDSDNIYVLNQGTGGNGSILKFDRFANLLATNASALAFPTAMTLDFNHNLFIAEQNGTVQMFGPGAGGSGSNTFANVTSNGVQLAGIALFVNGSGNAIAVSDAANHVIWQIDAVTRTVSLLTGTVGVPGTNLGSSAFAKLNQPLQLALAAGNLIVVADSGNNRVVVVDGSGSITNVLNSTNALVYYGLPGDPVSAGNPRAVPMALPAGVVVASGGSVYDSEDLYNNIRKILNTGLNQALGFSTVTNGTNPAVFVPPPIPIPNSGYYPMGQIITVFSTVTNVHYTVDGTEPTTSSPLVTINGFSGGIIQWFNTTNDLTALRLKAFIGTNASATVSGQLVLTNNIGVPPGPNSAGTIYAGIGSTIVVPLVCNLQSNVQVRSFQFRVELTPNGAAQPIVSGGFDQLNISTNDFLPLVTTAQGNGAASNGIIPYMNGVTNGLDLIALGTSGNIFFTRFATMALLKVSIPPTANSGDTYILNVLFPSATSDGVNANVPLTPMPAATIVISNIAYTVGDSASAVGGWYNAGLFGNDDLDNSDVNNAFYAAAGLRIPYSFSDVFNCMDAYPEDVAGFTGGDGQIRIADWEVILGRSLRHSSNNWARAWSAGGNLINFTTNLSKFLSPAQREPMIPTWPWFRQALVGASSVGNAVPGTTVNVPVYVKLGDGCTLSNLQFRALITPKNGAPALTAAPQLNLAGGIPSPLIQQNFKAGEKAFGWSAQSSQALSFLSRSSNFLGWITFTVPASAQAGQSYTVSFANADGMPDLHTQYDFETRSASVAVNAAATPASICSDEWKIHFFGSLTNPNAADTADPDGDGVPNWMEYIAGTDPNDASSKLRFTGVQKQVVSGQLQLVTHWLTAPGKAYEVQWSSAVTGGAWNTLTTVSGDGTLTTCIDTSASGAARYYRLRVLQ